MFPEYPAILAHPAFHLNLENQQRPEYPVIPEHLVCLAHPECLESPAALEYLVFPECHHSGSRMSHLYPKQENV